jgi:hypothetical protein
MAPTAEPNCSSKNLGWGVGDRVRVEASHLGQFLELRQIHLPSVFI